VRMVGTPIWRPLHPYRVFTIRGIRAEFEKRGFKVVQIRKAYFLPVALHRWINHSTFSFKIEQFFRRLGLTALFGSPVTLKAVSVERGR